ncbi:MAG: type III-B CRISPR module RAMP protein Cmr4 [Flavobacteriales bacterium]|nr:type III-B CRISPR module RAMP protein Cmr4 [Flavobacteriales bacterium]
MQTTDTWLIQAISNLHAGKGDSDFGIIDKHVQRDPVTHLPAIFASSIKGALRELFETNVNLNASVHEIFGSENGSKLHAQGGYRFYDARLLALPIRSSHQFYYLATCPEIIQDFLNDLNRHSFEGLDKIKADLSAIARLEIKEGEPQYTGKDYGDIALEDFEAHKSVLPEQSVSTLQKIILADRFALFNGNDFNTICNELPSVARNYLDNGISKNLWYEEIVPRESRFYFFTSRADADKDPLADGLKSQDISNTVQIGANATVGFGLCEIKKIAV